MFRVGDKVVPNGFKANGDNYYYGTSPEIVEWEEKPIVLTVERVEDYIRITVSNGSHEYNYHPSELRIATEKEIKALNETEEQKLEFEFDFDNYFYILELNDSKRFIATCRDFKDEIYGINENNSAFIDKGSIKKIIAIIPKR